MEIDHDAFPWEPWSPARTAERLQGVDAPWAVAAGWALELYAGEAWREHEDIEIAVPTARFDEVRAALTELELWAPVGEGRLRPLVEAPTESHQTWGLDRAARAWRLDVFREPSDGETWICRRDDVIRMPYGELVERTADGIPFLRPEVVLLFKAKRQRDKDEADFDAIVPRLDGARRAWLRAALERVHPEHPWLVRLG